MFSNGQDRTKHGYFNDCPERLCRTTFLNSCWRYTVSTWRVRHRYYCSLSMTAAH